MLPSAPALFYALLLLVHHAKSFSSSGPHIADVNILLPPKMTYPVEYRLQGSDGCFKWSWDHQDILSVLPEYNSTSRCSTSARLKSIAPYGGRKETAVYATDLNSGMMIRCKVYIDAISRIQIFHNSIKLDLDGLATLRVRAFDSEENVFSSLVGLQFSWRLMPEIDGVPHNLIHVPLKESPLSDCGGLCGDLDIQVKLEESGAYSDLFVVKGTGIGHEIVSVHLLEPSFMHLEDKIVLTVAEAMSLDPPSPVFVIVGAVVNYNLKVIRNNSPHLVSLPSPFHKWSVLNSSVAQVEGEMGKVHALDLGMTAIVVDDTRVVGHMQTSSLHVVLPDSLLLFISPLSLHEDLSESTRPIPSVSRWYVVSGRHYLIEVKVFSPGPGAQEIYVTESDDIELHDSNIEFWDILPVSDSITTKPNYGILNANLRGLGRLTATLGYRSGHDMRKEVLKVVQEVMVCDQVKFMIKGESGGASDSILLPWVPGLYQDLELEASGGCAMSSGDYKWYSSDVATVSVSASGIVQAKKPGKSSIRAVSIFDSLNYDEVVVEVTSPSSMVILPGFPVETSVGTYLQASVTLKAPSGSYFYACDAFRSLVKWKTESESFIIVNGTVGLILPNKQEVVEPKSSSHGPPCAWTVIYASKHGRSVVHATLTKENQHFDQTSTGHVVLKVSSNIAAYLPLIAHQASNGNQFGGYWFDLVQAKSQNQLSNLEHLYLVPGTHMDIMLNGGPERWDQDVEYLETVEGLDEHQLHVKGRVVIYQMPTSNGDAYRIGCESLGSFKLIFRRGNLVGKDHPLPAVAEVQLSLTCSFPSTIVIIADEALNAPQILQSNVQANRTPVGIRASPVTVANGRRIRVSAVGISDSGKAFANSSSLDLRWELIGCQGMVLMDDAYSSSTAKSSWERFLILQNTSGQCTICATVVSFIDSLGHLDFIRMPEGSMNNLTDSIQLQLVSTLRISPEFSLLFFSLDARLNLSITGGSCFLDIMVNDTQIAEVMQQSPAYHCSHLMLAPKSLGYALVTVHDIGLVPPLVASSAVQVADIEWLKITTGEHISIMEGNLQSLQFLAGVGDGWSFDSSQYIYMNIHVHIEDDMVELVEDYDFAFVGDGYVHAPNFTIRGTHLGVTTIYLSIVQHSGLEILSQPVKVEVYAPPRIHPSDIFLVPGASFVLTVRGGPKLGTHAQYASMDGQIAQIRKSSGRLSAISPGNSTVVVTIYSTDDFLLCQAYAAVKIGIPSSAILNVQSEQLAVGRSMRIHSSLSEGDLFSFYGLCKNFNWTVEDEEILNFHVANHAPEVEHDSVKNIPSGYLNKQDSSFIQVMYGLSAGKTNVTVSFSCDIRLSNSLSKSVFYSASRLLWVVSDLPLALGSPMTWILPPHYTSSDLLPLFSHGYNKGDPQSDKVAIAYSLLGHYNRKAEEVQDTAIHIKGAKIITKGFDNLVCIQAKDRSTGRNEVASCVKVTEVAQIRIVTDEFPVHTLPVDAQLDLSIKYHDALGNPFHEAHNVTLFEAETNNPDVISIDTSNHNGSIHLLAKSQGMALLQISFINDPQKSDYILISVGPHLYPQNPVMYQGTSLNFGVKGFSDSTSGQWFSGNASIVSVERRSGKTEAIRAGQTHVNFKSSSLKLSTQVTVLETNTVSVEPPREVLTNVPFPLKGYAFSVKFSDAYTDIHEVFGNNMLSLFECAVDPPHIGFSKPAKDLDTDNLYCLFFPYSPEHLARSTPNLGNTGHHTSVFVRASLKGNHRVSGSASAVFIGGFKVLEIDQHSLHLNMTQDSNKRIITIIGNTDIEINWRDRNRLSIRPIREGDAGEGRHVRYEVKVLGAESFEDQLILTLPATGQSVEINVRFEAEGRKAVVKTAAVTSWIGVVAILFLLIITVTFLIYCLDRLDRSEPIVPSGTPSVAAPVTPERSSPAVINDQSPRTPQPFIDYVRRTLDETPYYRQDFRRRINPQNTY